MSQPLHPDARNLEEEFFLAENRRLLDKLRAKEELAEKRQMLREVLGIQDDELVDHLNRLGIEPETALALSLVPLAVVAWSDGSISDKEREAILKAATEHGVAADSSARTLLESWLETQPSPGLINAWKRYARTLWESCTEVQRTEVRDSLIGGARKVAEASGGFLGLGKKVSAQEQATLDDLESVLS
ncbi:hypothetical protein ABI59_21185 [Acidobacteria bacterium Mor1]|nr:hypothetical protein ABI59_21185 [Acidobacteria bacterium Mor1]